MARLQRRRFSDPVEVRHFPRGRLDIVELDDVVVGRMSHEPGWRWSVDVRPLAGTDRCMYHHVGVTLSGRCRAQLEDGTELEIGPGDVFEFPPGHDAWVVGDEPWVAVDFAGVRAYARPAEQRVLRRVVALLFSDIVDSTALAAELGEERWRELHGRHNERAQAVVDRYEGTLVEWTGDGMLAVFDSAERAVQTALACRSWLGELGLKLRHGIHVGEVEVRAHGVRGVAVHAAARLMSLAGAGEILVSAGVRDVLDPTQFGFGDRGSHELKGLAGPRQVYAVEDHAPLRSSA
jgi:class 3 adenylate cyclase